MIQHRIDLFAAGFEYNETARIDLDESRKALLRYKSGIDSLRPVEERAVEDPRRNFEHSTKAVGGIHAIVDGDTAHLFALGSASRKIPHEQWEIPLPVANPECYAFCPHANVFAAVEFSDSRYVC